MKYTVTRACGHIEVVELFGKAEDRQRKIEWLESTECSDCYNAIGCEEIEMHYSEYKNKYSDCKTKKNSYDRETKTIVVFVPVKTEEETEAEEIIAEALEIVSNGRNEDEAEAAKAWDEVEKRVKMIAGRASAEEIIKNKDILKKESIINLKNEIASKRR